MANIKRDVAVTYDILKIPRLTTSIQSSHIGYEYSQVISYTSRQLTCTSIQSTHIYQFQFGTKINKLVQNTRPRIRIRSVYQYNTDAAYRKHTLRILPKYNSLLSEHAMQVSYMYSIINTVQHYKYYKQLQSTMPTVRLLQSFKKNNKKNEIKLYAFLLGAVYV